MYNDGLHSDNFILLGFVKINIISYWKEIWNGFDDGEAICSIDVYPFLAFSTWKRILYLLFSYHHGCKHYFLLHVHCERYPGILGHISHLYVLLDVCILPHDVVVKWFDINTLPFILIDMINIIPCIMQNNHLLSLLYQGYALYYYWQKCTIFYIKKENTSILTLRRGFLMIVPRIRKDYLIFRNVLKY